MSKLFKTKNLIAIGRDAKTVKGEKQDVLTGIMYLAPHNESGFQVCPNASDGCKASCLYTAGHGRYSNVQRGRINKTIWFFKERKTFLELLVSNIEKLVRKSTREDMLPTIRLNGTSDIAWEKFKVVRDGEKFANIMTAFPDVQFYDYTKILGRKTAIALDNYHLTFSLAEDNDAQAVQALEQGYNVAVVLKVKPSEVKPTSWSGYPLINGDDSDIRFNDPKGGHIVGLTAKGKARYDETGFVREIDGNFFLNQLKLKLVA